MMDKEEKEWVVIVPVPIMPARECTVKDCASRLHYKEDMGDKLVLVEYLLGETDT